jgi:predicted kinase
MSSSVIVLITGFPGTGKTTLGNTLSEKYKFPFITKDAFKERIFDTLGWSDKAWSLKVSAASHKIMDYVIEEELKAGHSIIVESNFKPGIDSDRFKRFQFRFGCAVVQILCWAEGEVVYKRFMDRKKTTIRHAGHVEGISPEAIRQQLIRGKCGALDIQGTTIELDTTDFSSIQYKPVYEAIETA